MVTEYSTACNIIVILVSLDHQCMDTILQNPETGGSGGSKFSLKILSTKLRGGDTSYFARMAQATRELQESEDNLKQAQRDLE